MYSPLIITRPDILHQLRLMRCAVYSDLYYRVRAYKFADSQPLQIHLSRFGHAMFAQKAKAIVMVSNVPLGPHIWLMIVHVYTNQDHLGSNMTSTVAFLSIMPACLLHSFFGLTE